MAGVGVGEGTPLLSTQEMLRGGSGFGLSGSRPERHSPPCPRAFTRALATHECLHEANTCGRQEGAGNLPEPHAGF